MRPQPDPVRDRPRLFPTIRSIATTRSIWGFLLLSLALGSCQTPVDTGPLSPGERRDIDHVVGQMRDLAPFALDLSDDLHHRFFLKQLELAGHSPQRSPQLYRTIAEQRENHLQGNFTQVAYEASDGDSDEGLTPQSALNYIAGIGFDGYRTFDTTAVSSIQGGTVSTTMTLGLYDAATSQLIGTPATGGGNDGALSYGIDADGYTATDQVYSLYTYYWIDMGGNYNGPYTLTVNAEDDLPVMNNVDPTGPTSSLDDPILLCVNRVPSTGNNCTYGESTRVDEILFPVTGSIDYPAPVDVDGEGVPVNASVTMNIVNISEGGGCSAWGPNTADFFAAANTTLTNDNQTLSYNFDPADFGSPDGCFNNGDYANYSFVVLVYANDTPQVASVTSSPPDQPDVNAVQIPQMEIISGCLAAGSLIELADGTLQTIESFEAEGELVRTGSGGVLTVAGNTVGREPIPMVDVTDDRGHRLLLTQDHPVITVRRGVRLARELAVGDQIVTVEGDATLASVERVAYEGEVYNLLLGAAGEHRTKGSTTMYANGILVGDARMQKVFGDEFRQRKENVLDWLPEEWHEDYLNSLEDRR